MSKEIRLSQISHKNYALSVKNLQWSQCSSLISIIKKYGGRWNPSILQFEFPLVHTGDLIKEIKQVDERLIVKDLPSHLLKTLFLQGQDDLDRKVVYLTPKNKWNRLLVLDYLLVLRYRFVGRSMGSSRGPSTPKQPFKRVLLLCSQRTIRKWASDCFEKFKISYKQADYQSLMPEESYRIGTAPLYENQVDILAYEKLEHVVITKKVMEKYHTLICDDSDIWLDRTSAIYSSQDLGTCMQKIIRENYGHQKELIMICSKVPIQKPNEMLLIANLIKPKQFGTDVFRIARNECADALWMKKRYIKENKYGRQMLYILQSTFFINLAEESKENNEELNRIDKITYQADPQSKLMINSLSVRFKHVDFKSALKCFQSQRSRSSYSLGQTSKLDEGRYIKQLRQIMLIDKFTALTKYIYYLAKELKQRLALVVENQQALEKVEKFLIEQQIGYVVYEISMEEVRKGRSYLKFNLNQASKVCLLVRDKLLQEYRKCELEREKQLEEEMLAQAEAELGIEKGACFQLAHHYRDRLNNPLFKNRATFEIPIISTIHHIVHFDTFWFDFSVEKQSIIDKIISQKSLFYSGVSKIQQQKRNDEIIQGETLNPTDIINHYFICEHSLELSILEKYLAIKKVFQAQRLESPQDEKLVSLEEFQKQLFLIHQKKCEKCEVVNEVFDIDEQFDRLQFQAMKQKQAQSQEEDKPRYNNYIQGLIPQTICLKIQSPAPKDAQLERDPFNIELKQRSQEQLREVDWLNQAQKTLKGQSNQSLSESSSAESIDLKQYLIDQMVNRQVANDYLLKAEKVVKSMAKQSQENLDSSNDSMPSLHLDVQENSFEATIKKQPIGKRKLQIVDTPKQGNIIEILDDQEMLPLPIVGRTEHIRTKVAKYRRHNIKKPQSNYKIERGPAATGIKLWGKRSKEEKTIAKKYMDIKVRLSSYKSTLKQA